jgi:hypothetical protein
MQLIPIKYHLRNDFSIIKPYCKYNSRAVDIFLVELKILWSAEL